MKTLPAPAIVAALTAVIALPFSLAAGVTFLVTAALGFVIHADYVQRRQRIRLPRRSIRPQNVETRTTFVGGEIHQLAA